MHKVTFLVELEVEDKPTKKQIKNACNDIKFSLKEINDCMGIGGEDDGLFAEKITVSVSDVAI